jgi:hypothetical protein
MRSQKADYESAFEINPITFLPRFRRSWDEFSFPLRKLSCLISKKLLRI